MKGRILLIAFLVSFLVFGLLYLVYDNKGFEYGLGCSFCNKKLPYNLKPHHSPQVSFTLKDEDDLEVVGIGFRYQVTSFKIKDILAYGYNDTSVVLKCIDSINSLRYLASYETGYKTSKGNPEISFKDLSNNNFEKINDRYHWFEVDKENYYLINRYKFLFILGALISLTLFVWNLFGFTSTRLN